MFDGIRRFLGAIQVTQTDTTIFVSGIPADVMAKDISKMWSTSKITTYMFNRIDKNSFSFPLYFAPDIVYALQSILTYRFRGTSARTLNFLIQKLLTETWLKQIDEERTGRLNYSKLKDLVYQPLPYQMDFINSYNVTLDKYNLKGYLLAGAAGSGKTFTSLAVAQCLEVDLVIVVCPKNALQRVWESSLDTLFHTPQKYWSVIGNKPVAINDKYLLANYEAMDRLSEAMRTRMRQIGPHCKVVVILDESHNLNEINSLRTERFIDLTIESKSKNVIWLSGTPIKALGSESIPLLKCIDNYFTADVEERFRKIFGKNATKGLDILKHRLGLVSFKVEKKELKLLDPIIQSIKVSMPSGKDYTLDAISADMSAYIAERTKFYQKTESDDKKVFYNYLDTFESKIKTKTERFEYLKYRECLKTVIRCYKHGDLRSAKEESMFCNKYEKVIASTFESKDRELFRHVKTIAKYMLLKVQGECLGRVLSRKRIECHVKMIPYIDFVGICETTSKKTVVFTSFVDALKECYTSCVNQGLSPKVVYGDTNVNLNSIIKDFESNIDTNPLIATYNSLSTAVPLIMADTMITINFPFRDYVYQQAISRIHRLGADTQTYVYNVSLNTGVEPNISTRSADILQWSQQQVEKIMGITSPFEVVDTTGLESIDDNVFMNIVSEEHDIIESISFESISDLISKPSYAKW